MRLRWSGRVHYRRSRAQHAAYAAIDNNIGAPPPSAPGKESVLARALYDPFLQWYGYRTDVVAETLLLWGCCLAFAKLWIDPISSIAIAACSATLLALICQDIRLPDNHEAIKTQHRRQLQIHKQQRIPWRRFVSYVPIKSLPLEVDTRDGGHG